MKRAYNFVFQPFEINKFPYDTLGFGTYMTYFSKFLLKKPETQYFLSRFPKTLSKGENLTRAYQSEVLGNLSNQNVGKLSLLEMVEILHHSDPNSNEDVLLPIKQEMNCSDNDWKIAAKADMYKKGEFYCKK